MDCLAVIRAPLELYPPSLNQVALLAEAGLRVGVVDMASPDCQPWTFSGVQPVERFHADRHLQLHKEKSPSTLSRFARAWKFQRTVRRLIAHRRPKIVIAYDPYGMQAVGKIWQGRQPPKLIWHFHELCLSPHEGSGFLTSRAVRFTCEYARVPDLVVYPDQNRAETFARALNLEHFPTVVMNCPRRLASLPENRLTEKLKELGHNGAGAVYFQGWIGPSRCVEAVIESMRHWPAAAVLVLVGPVAEPYRKSLAGLADKLGVSSRVIFWGSVPYSEVWHLAVGASVGLSLVADQADPNWQLSAGAINKRFEYMAVQLPQVANTGPGMGEIIERPQSGLLVNPNAPEEIGRAVASLLENEILRQELGRNGRQAHLDEFNYERQFAPVLARIVEWSAAK